MVSANIVYLYTRGPSTSAGNHENEEDEGKCNKVKPKFV